MPHSPRPIGLAVQSALRSDLIKCAWPRESQVGLEKHWGDGRPQRRSILVEIRQRAEQCRRVTLDNETRTYHRGAVAWSASGNEIVTKSLLYLRSVRKKNAIALWRNGGWIGGKIASYKVADWEVPRVVHCEVSVFKDDCLVWWCSSVCVRTATAVTKCLV